MTDPKFPADPGPPSDSGSLQNAAAPAVTQVAIAVVEFQGRFLVGQRPDDRPLGGCWEFPGGKVQPGESPQQAAERECREETGIDVQVGAAYPARTEHYPHGTIHLMFFACRPVSAGGPPGELPPRPNPPFRWLPRLELDNYRFPEGNRDVLRQLREPAE